MKNYYAYLGNAELEKSKSLQIIKIRFKAKDEEFARKICNNKFGNKEYKLYFFTSYNENKTFTEIK